MKKEIDFSIIIPTRNRKEYLKEAIESILNQEEKNIQIIVIDDNSNDGTEKMIEEYYSENDKILYIKNSKSLFAHNSRKKGYNYAIGKYIIFMDDDDFYIDKSFFKKALIIFKDNKDVNTVIGSTIAYEDGSFNKIVNLKINGIVSNDEYLNNFGEKYQKPMSTLSAIFRKSALDNINLKESKMINDTCIYLYGILYGDIYIINKPVAAYRIHENNISKKRFQLNFIKKCLDEKRKIYKIAKSEEKLYEHKKWYYSQISPTIYYFISSSNKSIIVIIMILMWICFYGKRN